MTPTTTEATRPQTVAELERAIGEAREALSDAERELEAADAAVDEARERQGLGLAVRGATIRAQVARSRKHEAALVARGRLTGLERQLAAQRDREADERARAVAVKRQGFLAEAKALGTRAAEVVANTLEAFGDLEDAYADLNRRAGGSILSQAHSPADYPGVYGRLIGSLEQLAQLYGKPTPKPATNSTKGG
jgi:hypothetical protein